MERLRVGFIEGNTFVFEADIRDFFGSIDHDRLMSLVEERVSDRRVLKLLRGWLRAGVLVNGKVSETVTGTPLLAFITDYDQTAKPFRWTYAADPLKVA